MLHSYSLGFSNLSHPARPHLVKAEDTCGPYAGQTSLVLQAAHCGGGEALAGFSQDSLFLKAITVTENNTACLPRSIKLSFL